MFVLCASNIVWIVVAKVTPARRVRPLHTPPVTIRPNVFVRYYLFLLGRRHAVASGRFIARPSGKALYTPELERFPSRLGAVVYYFVHVCDLFFCPSLFDEHPCGPLLAVSSIGPTQSARSVMYLISHDHNRHWYGAGAGELRDAAD
jgi:hypothetical protein